MTSAVIPWSMADVTDQIRFTALGGDDWWRMWDNDSRRFISRRDNRTASISIIKIEIQSIIY